MFNAHELKSWLWLNACCDEVTRCLAPNLWKICHGLDPHHLVVCLNQSAMFFISAVLNNSKEDLFSFNNSVSNPFLPWAASLSHISGIHLDKKFFWGWGAQDLFKGFHTCPRLLHCIDSALGRIITAATETNLQNLLKLQHNLTLPRLCPPVPCSFFCPVGVQGILFPAFAHAHLGTQC